MATANRAVEEPMLTHKMTTVELAALLDLPVNEQADRTDKPDSIEKSRDSRPPQRHRCKAKGVLEKQHRDGDAKIARYRTSEVSNGASTATRIIPIDATAPIRT